MVGKCLGGNCPECKSWDGNYPMGSPPGGSDQGSWGDIVWIGSVLG